MGLFDGVKKFIHSVTTEDHYALYGNPYTGLNAGGSLGAALALTAHLTDLNNSLTHSLMGSRNTSLSNVNISGGYRPGMRSSHTSLPQEMQTLNQNGQPPLPLMESLWLRIELFLEEEYPELEDALNSGASTADLNEFEKDLAAGPLPIEFRQFYKTHDGQFRGGKPTGLLMGMTFLDIESIMEEYMMWAKAAQRIEKQQAAYQHQEATGGEGSSRDQWNNSFLAHQRSFPADAVQPYYIHRGWVPLTRDLTGNVVGLDLAPGPGGVRGQVILYGRDFDTKVVVASSFQEFVFSFVLDLEAGNFQIDKSELDEDNGFLDLTRDDDYGIGDQDEDNGDLRFLDRDGSEFGAHNRGKFSYLDALKTRALKRHGVADVAGFRTSFTPQRMPRKKLPVRRLGPLTPLRVGSPAIGKAVESTADLLKVSLIDEAAKAGKKEEKKVEAKEEKLEKAEESKGEAKPEETALLGQQDSPKTADTVADAEEPVAADNVADELNVADDGTTEVEL